jgi:hypothetical protein
MAVLFFAVGWLTTFIGAAWGGYTLYTGVTTLGSADVLGYVATSGASAITSALLVIFAGLLFLALGGILSRLDEIAYNTRALD